jgi:hypothetical protein
MRRIRHKPRRSLRQRVVAGVTLAAYVVAGFGLPLPAGAAAKDSSQPFPCQHHGCGCHSAEQCWAHCCCFTPEQRWAWAAAHQVEPPSCAQQPAGAGWRSEPKREQKNRRKRSEQGRSCCQTPRQVVATTKVANAKKQAPQKGTQRIRWALGMTALGCQGKATTWASMASALPPAAPVTWTPIPGIMDHVRYAQDNAITLTFAPVTPPPRLTSHRLA